MFKFGTKIITLQRKMRSRLAIQGSKIKILQLLWQKTLADLVFKQRKHKNLEIRDFIDKALDIDPDIRDYVLKTVLNKLN